MRLAGEQQIDLNKAGLAAKQAVPDRADISLGYQQLDLPRSLDAGDPHQRIARLDRLAEQLFVGVKGDDLPRQGSKHRGLTWAAARLQKYVPLDGRLAQFVLLLNAVLDEGAAFFVAGLFADLFAQERQPLLRGANLDRELIDLQLGIEILDKEQFLALFDTIPGPRTQLDDLSVVSGIHHLALHRHKLPFRL